MRFKHKLIIIIIVIILFSIFTTLYITRKYIRDYTVHIIMNVLSESMKTEIKYKEVHGNIISGIKFRGLSFKTREGIEFHAGIISINYNPLKVIFQQKLSFEDLYVKDFSLILKMKEKKKKENGGIKLFLRRVRLKKGRVVLEKDSLYINDLEGSVNLKDRDYVLHIERGDLNAFLKERNLHIKNLFLDFKKEKENYVVKKFILSTDKSFFNFKGVFSDSFWDIKIEKGDINFSEFSPASGNIKISGKLQYIEGKVVGNIKGKLENMRYGEFIIPLSSFRISGIKDTVFFASYGENVFVNSFLSLKDTSINLHVEMHDFSLHNFYRALNKEVTLTGRMDINGNPDSFFYKVTFPEMDIDDIFFENVLIKGEYKKGFVSIDSFYTGDKKKFVLGYGELNSSNLSVYLMLNNFNLRKLSFLSKMKGILEGNIEVKGRIDEPEITGSLFLKKFSMSSYSIRDASLYFNKFKLYSTNGDMDLNIRGFRKSNLSVDSFHLSTRGRMFETGLFFENNLLLLAGNSARSKDSFEIKDGGIYLKILNKEIRGLVHLTLDKEGVKFDTIYLTGEPVNEISAKVYYRKNLPELSLIVDEFDLNLLESILKQSITGLLSLNLRMDSLSSLRFKISDLTYAKVKVDASRGDIKWNGNILYLDSLKIWNKGKISLIHGTVGLRFSGGKIHGGTLSLNIDAHNPGVWIFLPLKHYFVVDKGYVEANMEVRGDLRSPYLYGTLKAEDVSAYIPYIKNRIEKGIFYVVFSHDTVFISEGSNGRVGDGIIKMKGYIIPFGETKGNLIFEAEKAPISPLKDVYATVTGALTVHFMKDTTSLKGEAYIHEALITRDLTSGNGNVVKRRRSHTITNYEFKLKGDRNIWLRNKYMDVELKADFTYREENRKVNYNGKFEVIRGFVYYMGHSLRIKKGVLTFPHITELNPEMDIWAELPTRDVYISEDRAEKVKIVLHLSGTLKNPEFEFMSIPPVLTQSDIITYMNLNMTLQELEMKKGDTFIYEALSNAILSIMGTEASKKIKKYTGLDYLNIEMQESDNPQIEVGKYLGRNLFIYYSHSLKNIDEDEFRVEYYLGKGHELIGEKDKENKIKAMYRFKIRY